MDKSTRKVLEQIADKHLGITTLESRNMDDLDFHTVGVVSLRAALEAAYEAGRRAGGKN